MRPPAGDDLDDPEDRGGAGAAGEYVLGLLEGEEQARFERRLAADPALRREVAGWERRLAPLALSVDEVPPPPDVWPRIERSLRDALRPAWGSAEGRRGEGQGRDRRRRRAGGGGGASSLLWRVWAVGATAVAAGLAALLVLRQLPPTAGVVDASRLVAVLTDAQSRPAYLLSATPGAERLSARPVTQLQPGGRVYELWLLPGDDAGRNGAPAAPVSLGLLDPSTGAGRALPEGVTRLLTAGRGVAVSLEPPGGSPTGAPTGPVVYTGVLLPDPETAPARP